MSDAEIESWVLGLPEFQAEYAKVVTRSLGCQFKAVERDAAPEHVSWGFLLNASAVLARSDREGSQSTVLRIVHQCLRDGDTTLEQRIRAALVLDSLANRVGVRLAEQRNYIPTKLEHSLSALHALDWLRNEFVNSTSLHDGSSLFLNRFQAKVWSGLQETDWLSISAPTSSGKSFVITRWTVEWLRQRPSMTVAVIVPTRALVSQMESDFKEASSREGLKVNVVTLPFGEAFRDGMPNVLVFTQERMHLFLSEANQERLPELLIVDEAQKIGDGRRGILLQQVLEQLVEAKPTMKVVLASPLIENPDGLLQDAPSNSNVRPILSEDVVVGQNLFWASQVPRKPKLWSLSCHTAQGKIAVGQFILPVPPSPESKRLPLVAFVLGGDGFGNLVYVNGPAEAEKVAAQIFGLCTEIEGDARRELDELAKLIDHAIHPEFVLKGFLKRGVAFHYGNMPLIVRKEVERLFANNVLRFLICTSTLIEGVNLPCRNIFVRGPRKGKGKPMTHADFWNLAGRAGRWGKEFDGNIVCVDPTRSSVWKIGSPTSRTKISVRRATDEWFQELTSVPDFMSINGDPDDPSANSMFSFLLGAHERYGGVANSPWWGRVPSAQRSELESAVLDAAAQIDIPLSLVVRNPGINPARMAALLHVFEDENEPGESYLPVPSSSEDAVQSYAEIFERVDAVLGLEFGGEKRCFALALIVVKWMQGFPLPRIIDQHVRYLRTHDRPVDFSNVIRGTMADVEQFARFEAPRALAAYCDVLTVYLDRTGQSNLVSQIPPLSRLLEFGISEGTQMSLMGLGLSRTSCALLYDLMLVDELDREEAVNWLRVNREIWTVLPRPVLVEVENAVREFEFLERA